MTDKRDQKPADPMAGIHWDPDRSMSYRQYLQIEKVLTAQKPLSGQHDEMLFIVIHQASELWMKLCLHELAATRAQIKSDDLEPAFKMLSRVARIQAQLIQSWDVLGTMTPNGINMWVVSDNVRKGAALNAVQIAEILIQKYI